VGFGGEGVGKEMSRGGIALLVLPAQEIQRELLGSIRRLRFALEDGSQLSVEVEELLAAPDLLRSQFPDWVAGR
jgi:hypothetical protein